MTTRGHRIRLVFACNRMISSSFWAFRGRNRDDGRRNPVEMTDLQPHLGRCRPKNGEPLHIPVVMSIPPGAVPGADRRYIMGIEDLRGPPPEQDTRGMVLRHYHDITAARSTGWRWASIGQVMNMNGDAVRRAYERIHRRVESGLLSPPPAIPAPSKHAGTARQTGPESGPGRSNFTDLDKPIARFGNN